MLPLYYMKQTYNYTKAELEAAILRIAKEFGQEANFKALMEAYSGMPKIVEMISYQMFLNAFDSRSVSDELYNAYKAIHDYAKSLNQDGFVEYLNKNEEKII